MPAESEMDEVPRALVPAVEVGIEVLDGLPSGWGTTASRAERVEMALIVLRVAIDARAVVPAEVHEDVVIRLRQAEGRFERIGLQMVAVGDRRAELERLIHRMADALGTGKDVAEVLDEYRNMAW